MISHKGGCMCCQLFPGNLAIFDLGDHIGQKVVAGVDRIKSPTSSVSERCTLVEEWRVLTSELWPYCIRHACDGHEQLTGRGNIGKVLPITVIVAGCRAG